MIHPGNVGLELVSANLLCLARTFYVEKAKLPVIWGMSAKGGPPTKPKAISYRNIIKKIRAVVAIALMGLGIRIANADSLYIGDANDNTVKRFDASTGKYLGIFVTNKGCENPPSSPPPGCLFGPTGLIFDQGNLLVANQNVNLKIPGAILSYNGVTGAFVNALVPSTAPTPPPAPRGIVLKSNTLFVASLSSVTGNNPGVLQAFNGTTGAFVGTLAPPAGLASAFHPVAS